ncbi:MAG: ABC transporter ATP-binding protein [Saccharofermentanales bacterium]|jgi:multiple sugar transport system ATP-binding protein
MSNVKFENVYKIYDGDVVAVTDFNLDIENKEFIILVGPSGCGKSTTLRMIAGLEDISKGTISIDGEVVNDIGPKDRDISMVFQNYALYPHMTVYENMAFGLKLRKIPKEEIDQRVMAAAKILELEPYLDRKPRALSGGQQQRVALGRSIVRKPKVFLMDEPLSNLDAKLRVQMRVSISRLHQQLGATIVYVTHDQTEAMTMGTRIVVMKDGLVQQVASPSELYYHPTNLFVAGFIGMPPMNFLDAVIEEKNGKIIANFDDFEIELDKEKYDVPEVREYFGKEVILGVRPEAISDRPDIQEEFPNSTFEGDIEVVEMLGAECYIYLIVNGHRLTARVDSSTWEGKTGESLNFTIDAKRVALFDKETEKAIIT